MKTKPTRLDESGPGFDSKKFWRHYVATVDTDQEWSQERPQPGRGSNRLFLFLLLFHIFLIAAVVLFNLVAERPKPVFVDNSIPAGKSAKGGPAAGKAGAVTGAQGETVAHTVTEGDTLKSIAAASGVSQEEIARMNNINVDTRLAAGSVLRVPKPKAKAAIAILPVPAPVQPARVPENVITIKPEVETSMFAAVTPTTALKKVELTPPPKPEVVATKLPEEKPKPKVEDSPPPAPKAKSTAKIEDSPPAAKPKTTAKVEDSPPAAKPKTTAKVEDSPPASKPKAPAKVEDSPPSAKPKPTEAKALVRAETSAKRTEPAKPATAKSAASTKPAASSSSHTVKPKETFYSISRKYGVNVNELMKANGFSDPAKLREGVVLKLPK